MKWLLRIISLMLSLCVFLTACGKKDKQKNTDSSKSDSSSVEDFIPDEESSLSKDISSDVEETADEEVWEDYEIEPEFYIDSPSSCSNVGTVRPTFSWTELEGASSYTLIIKQHKNNAYRKVKEIKGIKDTEYKLNFDLKENELYRYVVYGYVDGKRYVADGEEQGTLFVSKFNPKTHAANKGLNFTFKDSITEEVLRNYMSRAMVCYTFVPDGGLFEFEENLRMILYTGAKYVTRSVVTFYPDISELDYFSLYEEYINLAHSIDPEIIFEAGVFEAVGPQMDEFPIPAYVFKAFDLPVEKRNFDWTKMTYEDGHKINVSDGQSRPDMSRLETQMWFYYRATSYIDAGFESLHLGSTVSMNDVENKKNYSGWDKVTLKIREYAKTHARRGYVILNGHTTDMKTADNRLIFDFNMWMICGQVPDYETEGAPTDSNPQELEIVSGATGSIYGKTNTGGKHYCGFELDEALYMVELDNYGIIADQIDKPTTLNGMYPWGIDEMGWFYRQPDNYRRWWLDYAYNSVKSLENRGYFAMPGLRRGSSYDGLTSIFYRANNAEWGYEINGKNDEETIRDIWIASNK